MSSMSPEDVELVRRFMPQGAIPTHLTSVVAWLDPETGEEHWCTYWAGDGHLGRVIGFLEMAKVDIMARMSRGQMFQGEESD